MGYGYIKIADTEHGELGHNGWAWVLNHPYGVDDRDHPAFYEETGLLTVASGKTLEDDDCEPRICFDAVRTITRGNVQPRPEIIIPVSPEQARAAQANRQAYDAIHRPKGGYKVILD